MNFFNKKFLIFAGILAVVALIAGCNFLGNDGDNTLASLEIPGLPPDPGEAGKATLAGIDSDNDGVRDDVQRYIAITYLNSAKIRAALTQDAKVMQTALLDANDKEKSVRHGQETSQASECLTYVLGDDVAAVRMSYQISKDFLPIILNTDARNEAYFTYNDQLGGEVFSGTPDSQIASACDFDPSTLPN